MEILKEYNRIKYGWIDKRGVFRETGFYGHDDYAESLGTTEEALEKAGWVKVTFSDSISKNVAIWESDRLTKAQVNCLHELGFLEVEADSIGYFVLEP